MARMAKLNARVASSTTNEPECGTMKASAASTATTNKILNCWLAIAYALTLVRTSRSA